MWQEKGCTPSDGAHESGYRQFCPDVPDHNLVPDTMPTPGGDLDKGIVPKLLKFFGLAQQPFGVTPDPSFLYLSRTHREALASLIYGIETGRGFLALIAKPGMGKTTLLFHLLQEFRDSARSAFIFQTQCNSREFLQLLFSDLGFENENEQDFVRTIEEFNYHLLREARAGKRFIVLVDEAQNLDASVLETVRLLSNFETPSAKLLQIVLSGQPELGNKLAQHDMIQLQQRLSSVSRLEPFSMEETQQYIEHRLLVSGYRGHPLLTKDALDAVTEFSKGIPRNINNFCFNALSLAFALQRKVIDIAIAREVISDFDILLHPPQPGHTVDKVKAVYAQQAASEPTRVAEEEASRSLPRMTFSAEANGPRQQEWGGELDVPRSCSEANDAANAGAISLSRGPVESARSNCEEEVVCDLKWELPSSRAPHPPEEAAVPPLLESLPLAGSIPVVDNGATGARQKASEPSDPDAATERGAILAFRNSKPAPLPSGDASAIPSDGTKEDPNLSLAEAKQYMDNFIRRLRSTAS
jgi:general secretion pathway protein A